MISVTFFKTGEEYNGFVSEGHADYADEGYDIICSAVSVLTINTVNSIEELTDDTFYVEQGENGGFLKMMLEPGSSSESQLLLKSLELGLRSVEESYGNEFLQIDFAEHENDI